MKSLIVNWQHFLVIVAYQHVYRYYARAARLYLALADHEQNMNRRATFNGLLKYALRHMCIYANNLTLLHAPIPKDQDTRLDRAWRWLLVQMGISVSFIWLEWDQLHQTLLLMTLAKITSYSKAKFDSLTSVENKQR